MTSREKKESEMFLSLNNTGRVTYLGFSQKELA